VLPEPPPTAGDQTRPAWEIVQPDKQAAEDVAAAGVGAGSSSQASWELDPREQQRVDEFYKKHGRHEEVDEEDIARIVSKWTGIPVSKMLEGEVKKLISMEDRLRQRVVGQDAALERVANAIRRSRAGV